MDTEASTGRDTAACRRDVDRVVRGVDGVTLGDVDEASSSTVETSTVGDADEHRVFELTGLDCRTCAGLVQSVLLERPGVSNVTATPSHGTVRVDYDPDQESPAGLRRALSDLGYPVETTDEAFRNRRAAQWREARLVTGLLAGLMALVPYAAVVYPTRFAFWPSDPQVVALLERALASAFATHFYINIALLSGIVLLVTGTPILEDAAAAVRERTPNRSLAVGVGAVALYAYSCATAFRLLSGGVYYDVVILVVVGATVYRQTERTAAGSPTDEEVAEPSGSVPATPPDGD